MINRHLEVQEFSPRFMAGLSGYVQYRFRSDEQDTNILLRGRAEWVSQKVEELGLTGLGWTMAYGQGSTDSKTKSTSKSKAKPNIYHKPSRFHKKNLVIHRNLFNPNLRL